MLPHHISVTLRCRVLNQISSNLKLFFRFLTTDATNKIFNLFRRANSRVYQMTSRDWNLRKQANARISNNKAVGGTIKITEWAGELKLLILGQPEKKNVSGTNVL